MATDSTPKTLRGLSLSSLIFAVLGGGFYWWVPLGMVFGLTGLMFGFVDWTMARRRSLDYRLSIVGVLLSVAALTLDIVIAVLGLQTWTFGRPPMIARGSNTTETGPPHVEPNRRRGTPGNRPCQGG